MIDKILSFMKTAGEVALSKQSTIDITKANLKDGRPVSIVTEADFEISHLFKTFIEQNFNSLDYLIVDEETVATLGKNVLAQIKEKETTFIIDPIDGTLPYSQKLPFFAISVGIFRYGKPIYGAIYAPRLQTIVYYDGESSFCVENAFTSTETIYKIPVLNNDQESSPVFCEHTRKMRLSNAWTNQDVVPINIFSTVLSGLFVATHQSRAMYFIASLWDIAGCLPIFENLGIKIFNLNSGKEFNPFEDGVLNEKLKANELHVVCRPKYFEYFKELTEKK